MWLMYQQKRLIIAKYPRSFITNVDTAKSILNTLKLRLGLILYHDHSECQEATQNDISVSYCDWLVTQAPQTSFVLRQKI